MVPAIPAVIVILTGCAYVKRRMSNHGVMTPERVKIFNAAISGGMQDPDNLEKLAKSFEEQGLSEQGALLRQRARLKRLPNEIKLIRRQIWRKAIKSTNRMGMLKLADAYDKEGCTSAAMRLREIVSGLPDTIPEATATVSGEETPAEETADESSQPEEQAVE